jgi:NADPH:quinone reductase-like Zn-dependent oxidoreductase
MSEAATMRALRPHVEATYSLEHGAEALRAVMARRARGKLVVTIE